MINIGVILGSVRQGRFGDKPAQWIFNELKKRKGVNATFLDLKDYDLPNFDQPMSPAWISEPFKQDGVARWTKAVGAEDGFIIVAPEYNRSVGGAMKNAFDWVYPEWNRKAVGFVGYGSTRAAPARSSTCATSRSSCRWRRYARASTSCGTSWRRSCSSRPRSIRPTSRRAAVGRHDDRPARVVDVRAQGRPRGRDPQGGRLTAHAFGRCASQSARRPAPAPAADRVP